LQGLHDGCHYLGFYGQYHDTALPDYLGIISGGIDAFGGEASKLFVGSISSPQLGGIDAGGEQAFDQRRGHVACTDKANPEVC
jgi:hypothetical protein